MLTWSDKKILAGLMQKMALDSWVRPGELVSTSLAPERLLPILAQLGTVCTLGRGQQDGLWRLTDDARRYVLRRMNRRSLERAMDTAANPVATSLRWATGRAPLNTGTASMQELMDVRAALTWLAPGQGAPFPTGDLDVQIEHAALREDLQLLIGHEMIGRRQHMKRLHDFVTARNDGETRTLLVSGAGGSGKSTLLLKLFDDLQREQRIAVIRFDFDRADLNPLLPTVLERELIAHIGRAAPNLRAECDEAARKSRAFAAESARELIAMSDQYGEVGSAYNMGGMHSYDSVESSRSHQQSELGNMLRHLRLTSKRFVIMFDTFERVEAAGPRAVELLLQWTANVARLSQMSAAVIIAGRRELDVEHSLLRYGERLRLGDLTRSQSQLLLVQRGCPPHLASLLAQRLQARTPLVLQLAAETVLKGTGQENIHLLDELERGLVPSNLLSGYLYTRILAHIDQPVLRRYALASIALPELSQALVAHVIMPVLEPSRQIKDGDAHAILDGLAKVHWLMERTGDALLRLRPDVRSLILELVRTDTGSRVMHERLHSAAREYHLAQVSEWDAAMVLYHEIMLEERTPIPPGMPHNKARHTRALKRRYGERLRLHARYLLPFIDDFPTALRLTLSANDGNQVDLDLAKRELSDEEWKRLMDGTDGFNGRGHQLVGYQDPLTAHQLFAARPTSCNGLPPAYALQAACDTGRWDELAVDLPRACSELKTRFAHSRRWSPHLHHLAALLRHALFSLPKDPKPQLVALTAAIMARCAAYGAAPAIADLVAVAEVFHKRAYLMPELLEKIKPGDATNRIIVLHARTGGMPVKAELTPTSVVSLDDPKSAIFLHTKDDYLQGSIGLEKLQGQRWSQYQQYYRSLQKSVIRQENIAHNARINLPEFYRPLRQALLEAYMDAPDSLRRFANSLRAELRRFPEELEPDALLVNAGRDPFTWFYALVQYADRCDALAEVVKLAVTHAPPAAGKLHKVADLYRLWSETLPLSASRTKRASPPALL